jgi:hypothetical protein
MQVRVTEFAKRHFQENPGTTIFSHTPEEFEEVLKTPYNIEKGKRMWWRSANNGFCYYMTIPNFTDAKVSTLKLTEDNIQYLKSEYTQRRPEELPYLSRHLEMPEEFQPPRAEWLTLILYTRKQILKEANSYPGDFDDPFEIIDGVYDYYGIVGMQALSEPVIEPMTPYTMVRNALGKRWGGNGQDIDEKYIRQAAEYWNQYALVKTKNSI